MIAQLVVALYRFWHGRCHLKGGGYFLKKCSEFLPGLQNYPLQIEGLGTVPVDFRDSSGFVWLNHLLGEKLDTKVMEKGLFHALDRVLKEEDVFWDVGANIGTISVHVVTRHRHVRIFALNPTPGFSIPSVFCLPANHSSKYFHSHYRTGIRIFC